MNNAGVSTFGEVEFASLDNYKKVAEINLWGTVRVTKAFLPLIRRAKGNAGQRGKTQRELLQHSKAMQLKIKTQTVLEGMPVQSKEGV